MKSARLQLAAVFGSKLGEDELTKVGVVTTLLKAMVLGSGDVDVQAVEWLEEGFPIGDQSSTEACSIPPCGRECCGG